MSGARRLARFVTGLRLGDMPPPVVAQAHLLSLDTLGCALAAARYDFARAARAKSGVIAAWCFIFIGVIRELSASIILFTPATKVMSVVIFDLKEEGQFGAIAVLVLVMLALTFGTVAIVQAVLGRDVLGARD